MAEARRKVGPLPEGVVWRDVSDELPELLTSRFDQGMAEGVGWKLALPRLFPEAYELSLDNDCILWAMLGAVEAWLAAGEPLRGLG